MFMYFKAKKLYIKTYTYMYIYINYHNPKFISYLLKKNRISYLLNFFPILHRCISSIERNREPSTFTGRKNPFFLFVIDDSGCVVMRLSKQNEGRK